MCCLYKLTSHIVNKLKNPARVCPNGQLLQGTVGLSFDLFLILFISLHFSVNIRMLKALWWTLHHDFIGIRVSSKKQILWQCSLSSCSLSILWLAWGQQSLSGCVFCDVVISTQPYLQSTIKTVPEVLTKIFTIHPKSLSRLFYQILQFWYPHIRQVTIKIQRMTESQYICSH